MTGVVGTANVHGEAQKQLDVTANEIFLRHAKRSGVVRALVSEEMEAVTFVPGTNGRYGLIFDPLDGSSNIGVNGVVGTIFSIVELPDDSAGQVSQLLQPGRRQVAAGFATYGPSTVLVFTTGGSVDEFTLDDRVEAFLLSDYQLRIPRSSNEYAINASRYLLWDEPVRQFIDACIAGKSGPYAKNYTMRWMGSMVADIYRILKRGGIFLYPGDVESAATGGKLRLLYEANPMGMLIVAAGGAATTGRSNILDIQPSHLHQRVPVILGTAEEVERVVALYETVRSDPTGVSS